MDKFNTKQLRSAIAKYAKPNTTLALLIFITDVLLYVAAISGTIFFENIILRIFCGIFAGLRIGTLFLVSHDAAHDSYTGSRLLNRIIGRICFLPSLHNYSLWVIAHNRLHHQSPNLKGINSWSPHSKDEYDNLSFFGRIIEQFYRSPFGIWLNYMIERWWKNKFFPYKRIVGKYKIIHWLDFALIVTYLVAFMSMLIYLGNNLSYTSPSELLLFSFSIPFLVSNFLIGVTVYQHHTHESIPWFDSETEKEKFVAQEEITMHVQYPRWYNIISNNAMEHTAHHIDPRVPLYNLAKAQKVVSKLIGDGMVTIPFSVKSFLRTMSICKLYDYRNHCWLDFEGHPTSQPTLVKEHIEYQHAA